MKLKELCQQTGLSRKTVRLYEEKELFTPKKEYRNGREYRDYSQEDVQTLLVVASLRKAWFTMEEIRRMQQDPAAIAEILPQYQEWLRLQKQQLEGLLRAVEKLDPEEITDVAALSAEFAQETEKLPLPAMDIHPHFKYLDQMEEELSMGKPMKKNQTNQQAETDAKIYRQMAVTTSRAKWDDTGMVMGQMRETSAELRGSYDGPVREREGERAPLWLRIIEGLLTLIAVASGIVCFVYALGWTFPWQFWLIFAVSAGIRGALGYREYRKKQQAWIDRMEQNK